jgi:membrane-bound ClpP family serine protease
MTVSIVLVLVAASAVMLACLFLVMHPDYKCGVFGVLGLAMICMGAVTRVSTLVEACLHGSEYCANFYLRPVTVFVWFGLSLFMGSIIYRFLQRTKCRGTREWYDVA